MSPVPIPYADRLRQVPITFRRCDAVATICTLYPHQQQRTRALDNSSEAGILVISPYMTSRLPTIGPEQSSLLWSSLSVDAYSVWQRRRVIVMGRNYEAGIHNSSNIKESRPLAIGSEQPLSL